MKPLFKKLLAISLLISSFTTVGQVIDFEILGSGSGTGQAGASCYPCVFNDGGSCEVQFHLVDATQLADGVNPMNAILSFPNNIPHVVEIGGTTLQAFLNAPNLVNTSCRNSPTNLTVFDNPHATPQDFGCAFLTDELGYSFADSMPALLIEYGTPTTQLSGNILDVDFSGQGDSVKCEAWWIRCYDNSFNIVEEVIISACPPNNLGFPVSIPSGVVTGDGTASRFDISSTSQIKYVTVQYHPNSTRKTNIGLGFDNFSPCKVDTCCPGEELIEWGNFESQLSYYNDFYSDYSFSWTPEVLPPGYLNISRPPYASRFCDNWDFLDSDCSVEGRLLVVNGLTNGNGMTNVLSFKHYLEENHIYQLCFDAKWLEQCCFDQRPELTINWIDQNGATVHSEVETVLTNNKPCNWFDIQSTYIPIGSSGNYTIQILHNSDFFQDGSDFALDNLSFKLLEQDCNGPLRYGGGEGGEEVVSEGGENDFVVYPNPNTGEFKVDLGSKIDLTKDFNVEISSSMGEEAVFEVHEVSNGLLIIETNAQKGQYVIQISQGKTVLRSSFIVEG